MSEHITEKDVPDYTTKHRWQNRVRWWAAYQLNRLPWTCWANLVSWAMRSKPLIDRYGDGDVRQDYMCRAATECGRCYCGKIAVATSVIPPEVSP